MIRAYNENYLSRAIDVTAEIFDLAVNAANIPLEKFVKKFLTSDVAFAISTGSPAICAKSGLELCGEIIGKNLKITSYPEDRSPEFWLGWVLAFCQWSLNVSFATLNNAIPFTTLIQKYPTLHEAPREKTLELYAKKVKQNSKLKMMREFRGLSQSELAKISGVNVRNIRAYEQGEIGIEKASLETVLLLARALGCTVERLVYMRESTQPPYTPF